jgi:hypothetical protein
MLYFVGILVFVFCNVTGNSTEAGRTDLREGSLTELFRSESVDVIVELRNDLDATLQRIRSERHIRSQFLSVRSESAGPHVTVRARIQ